MTPQDRWAAVADRLRLHPRTRRRDGDGEVWLDHRCLFHDDTVASATLQPETGVYHCRVCGGGRQFTLEEVERELGTPPPSTTLFDSPDPTGPTARPRPSLADAPVPAEPTDLSCPILSASGRQPLPFQTGPTLQAEPFHSDHPFQAHPTDQPISRRADDPNPASRQPQPPRALRQSSPGPADNPDRSVPADNPDLTGPGDRPSPADPIDIPHLYLFPDGRPSHLKVRHQHPDGRKSCTIHSADGAILGRPKDFHPLYGEHQPLAKNAVLLVVEGELKVDAVAVQQLHLDGASVLALTAGSASDTSKFGPEIAARCHELEPLLVVLWPDNDTPGRKAFAKLAKLLERDHIRYAAVDPAALGFGPVREKGGQDVVDFLQAGGDLEAALRPLLPPPAPPPALSRIRQLVDDVAVLDQGVFIWPATAIRGRLTKENVASLWFQRYGRLPTAAETAETWSRLQLRGARSPVRIAHRRAVYDNAVYWRPALGAACWYVDAETIERRDDAPDRLVLPAEAGQPLFPADVDLGGNEDDLWALAQYFGLDAVEVAMIEGWLVCSLAGLQTPILLVKAQGASGKTTLARLLQAVMEPVCPEIDGSQLNRRDDRELFLQLQQTPVLLVDNVIHLGSELEEKLCKLVTGSNVSTRQLYTDELRTEYMQRALVLTTIAWSPVKSDLSSRLVVVRPRPIENSWLSDADATVTFGALLPKIRGHVLRRLQLYFQRQQALTGIANPFRVADLGRVLAALGYDVEELARVEAHHRAEAVSSHDLRLLAISEYLEDRRSEREFTVGAGELMGTLRRYGAVIEPSSPGFPRWMDDKAMTFRDLGWKVERVRTNRYNGYRFVNVNRPRVVQGGEQLELTES